MYYWVSIAVVAGLLGSGLAAQQRGLMPVVIDFNGDGIDLLNLDQGKWVDFRGERRRVAWTTPGTDDGFLALDENRDGRIDPAWELLGGIAGPPSGLVALAAYEGFESEADFKAARNRTSDGVVDQRDFIYRRLIVWIDTNGDGLSQEEELAGLAALGVTRIFTVGRAVTGTSGTAGRIRSRADAFRSESGSFESALDIVEVDLLANPEP